MKLDLPVGCDKTDSLSHFDFATQQCLRDYRAQHLVHHALQIPRAIFLAEAFPQDQFRGALIKLYSHSAICQALVQIVD